MFISIIIPVYNVENYVADCLRSVITQSDDSISIECIIVDDCGTDNSMEVVNRMLQEYSGPIVFKVLHHESNKGLSAARNTGIREAKGEYIFFLDSDDHLLPDALKRLSILTKKYPGTDIIQGEIQINKPNEGLAPYLNVSAISLPEYTCDTKEARHIILFNMPVTAWGKLIRRQFILANHIFFTDGMIHEDDMWAVTASQYIDSIAFHFSPVYWYNYGLSNSITSNIDQTKSLIARTRIIRNAVDCYLSNPSEDYLNYINWKLDISQKVAVWHAVKDKHTATAAIRQLRKDIFSLPCPISIKLAACYFSTPICISNNKFIKLLWKYFIVRLNNTQIKKLRSKES